MMKWYATITRADGTQLTVGEYSDRQLRKTLHKIHVSGLANLDESSVDIYTVTI